jgi:quercetin 2,3-dioxygenase
MKKIILRGHWTTDGAGVKLFRAFADADVKLTDPFLLLDNFGSDKPKDYMSGFPWHPHRGIETVTYMLEGEVEHQDNMGNKEIIRTGDVQWMTAGSGIIHQEMPKEQKGMLQGMQLWVNLPSANKMMKPRYRGITSENIPIVKMDCAEIKVIAGSWGSQKGPVKDLVVDVEYYHIIIDQGKSITYPIKQGYTTFCFVIAGEGDFDGSVVKKLELILYKDATSVVVKAIENLQLILVSGMPVKEQIVWGGPIVMNTDEELQLAFDELDQGTFIK